MCQEMPKTGIFKTLPGKCRAWEHPTRTRRLINGQPRLTRSASLACLCLAVLASLRDRVRPTSKSGKPAYQPLKGKSQTDLPTVAAFGVARG